MIRQKRMHMLQAKHLVSEKVEITCNNIIKRHKND